LFSVVDGHWKIGDFGIVAAATSKQLRPTTSRRGTDGYRAPELLDQNGSFSNKSDMWSLGCILFEMITGQQRFRTDYALVLYTVQKEPLLIESSFLPALSLFLVSEILQVDPFKRPSAAGYRRVITIIRFVRSVAMSHDLPGHLMLSAIHLSCLRGEMEQEIVMGIVECPQSMNGVVGEALIIAITNGRDEIAEALCRCSRSDFLEALRYASSWGSVSAVRFLLKQKIVINSQDENGQTALDIAVERKLPSVAVLLWESGAKWSYSSGERLWKLLAVENVSLTKPLGRIASVLPPSPTEGCWQISCTPLSLDGTAQILSVVSVPR